jgi:hypothetical protein
MQQIEVPEGTIGFTVLVEAAVSDDVFLGVQELRDPSGNAVILDFQNVAHPSRALSGPGGVGVGAVHVPLVDDDATRPLPAGTWSMKLGGSVAVKDAAKGTVTPYQGEVHGRVLLQTGGASASEGGMLDLDFYVPDGLVLSGTAGDHTVTAATAASDAEVAARVDETFNLFRRLYGIGRGEVRFFPIEARFTSIQGEDNLYEAHRRAASASGEQRAQVVLTNVLQPDDEGEISGNCGCLPGAPTVAGTICSSVVVAFRGGPAWVDASTIAHELGHFAGLEHTTELDGEPDNLSDTPECAEIGTKAGLLNCPDHDNLMFPSVDQGTAEQSLSVSPKQRALVRASSLYRASPR